MMNNIDAEVEDTNRPSTIASGGTVTDRGDSIIVTYSIETKVREYE